MIVYDELQKCCDMMALNGEDRKVYDICMQDLRNYLSYLERNRPKIGEPSNPKLETQDLGELLTTAITNDLYGLSPVLHNDLENTKEIAEFTHWWVKWWFRKWQDRTKIIFKQEHHQFDADSPLTSTCFTNEEQHDFKQIIIDKLIQYGEICCTDILANALFKKDIQTSQKPEWTTQDKVNLIPKLQRLAKEMSYTHGALVFIKPNKGYGLREWRDDNANKII
jgi:hypothetical protein